MLNLFKHPFKYIIVLILAVFIIGGYFVFFKKSAEAPVENNDIISEKKENKNIIKEEKIYPKPETLPNKISIEVPFTSQAPFANWDAYHEEACEEASLIMLKYYLDKKPLNKDIAEEEIQKMIAFQIKNHGDYKDTNAEETVKLFNDFYPEYAGSSGGKKLKVIYDFQKEEIKKELAKGNPVIIMAAGRLLGNPNYTFPGPLYHVLVLTGYKGDTIITNDQGTKKGENYQYDIDVLYNAIHDFPGNPEDIEKGRKAMIVLE